MTADIAFIDSLITSLEKSYCADGARVFLTGFSRGAYFANQLGCRTKSSIRAVATHGGGGPYAVENDLPFDDSGLLLCPAPPVAALQTHGDQDGPEEGMKSRDHWAAVNGCGMSTSPYDPSPCVSYDGCAAGRAEVWCLIPSMGHTIWSEAATATWDLFTSP
jgi:polyhydroxybutyrate depolymerase